MLRKTYHFFNLNFRKLRFLRTLQALGGWKLAHTILTWCSTNVVRGFLIFLLILKILRVKYANLCKIGQNLDVFGQKSVKNFFFKNRRTRFVEDLQEHVWSKYQLKIINGVLKKRNIVSKYEMRKIGQNVKKYNFSSNFWLYLDQN